MQKRETESLDVTVKTPRVVKGIVEPKLVRIISFLIITISLVACTVLCILAIWKFTESDAVWRAIATFIVVSIASSMKSSADRGLFVSRFKFGKILVSAPA